MPYAKDIEERIRIAKEKADTAQRNYEEVLRIKAAAEVRKTNATRRRGLYQLRKLNQGKLKLGLCACGCAAWVYPPASIIEIPGGPNLICKPECKKWLNRTLTERL